MNLMKRPLTDKWFFPYGVLLIVGFVALWMAVFPYIMVHIVVDSTRAIGTSHYSLLVPSAMAILFAGIWGLWFQNSDGRITSVGKIIFVALALVYGIFWYRGYLQLSAESALQKTLIKQFQKHPGWGNYSIYWIRIYFDGVQPVYSGYEWSGILSYVYGGHSRYGESYKSRQTYNSVYWDKTFTPLVRQLYNIEKWDENGCQATIKIIPLSEGKNPYVIGSLYLYYRLLDKKQLSSFLDHLMQVEVRPYQSIEATHCKKV